MKKKVFIFLLTILVLLYILLSFNINAQITGGIVTGEVTEASLSVTISITGAPILTITKPQNETYFENDSLKLKVNTNTNDMWYNLDNGANITFLDETFFNASEGSHTIYVFANNSFGTTTKNVSFTVNNSLYEIIYEEYKNSNKGDSTNFSEFSFTEIQNLSNIILENTFHGKIIFNGAINVTNDSNTTDSETNLDSNTNISSNRIELNTVALPNFNKNATLYLYNLTFSNPRILRNGVVCPSSICTFQSYSGGNLTFNVTGFTVYSAEETPPAPSPLAPEAGGGGGIAEKKFIVKPESYEKTVVINRVEYGEIEITNLEKSQSSFDIRVGSIEKIISFEEETIKISAGETKKVRFKIQSPEEPGIYAGKIIITSEPTRKEILVIINVKTEKSLFDITLLIPKSTIKVGENLSAQIDLFQVGIKRETNITLNYIIKNFNGNTHLLESETIIIYDQKSLIKKFYTEKFVAENYVLGVELIYSEGVAVASSRFKIEEKIEINIILILLILFIIFVFIIILREIEKHKRIIKDLHNRGKPKKR